MPSAKLAPHIAQKPRGAAKRECYPISDAQILRLLDGLPQTPSGECSCGAATRKRREADRSNQENYTLCRCETLSAPPQEWTLLGRMPIGEALPPLGAVGNAGEAMFHDLRRQPVLQQLKAEAAAMGSELVAYSLRHRYSDEGHRLGGS